MWHARTAELMNRQGYGCMSHIVDRSWIIYVKANQFLRYTTGFNIKAVEFTESSGNRSARRELVVSEKLACHWRKIKTELMKLSKGTKSQQPEMKACWLEHENKLQDWVLERRLKGVGISGTMIRLYFSNQGK